MSTFYPWRFLAPILLIGLSLTVFSCREKSYVYEVNEVTVSPNNAEKDKDKTTNQFVSILYSNLYQQALSPDQQVDLSDLIASIGDKQLAYETTIAKFLTDPDIVLPSPAEMRADPTQFVIDTYRRFLVRTPTQAELAFFVNYIESRPDVTPEMVFVAFATSNEYFYY